VKPIAEDLNTTLVITWEDLEGAGESVLQSRTGDRAVQVTGGLNPGESVYFEGSLDGDNWFTLHDPAHMRLHFSTPGLSAVLENTPFVRPRVQGTSKPTVKFSVRKV
jgi:hypothetical protein